MDKEFYEEQIGDMIIRKDKRTNEIISWCTFSRKFELNNGNRRVKVTIIFSKEIPLIKQIAKIKTMNSNLKMDDKEMIDYAKKHGQLCLGLHLPEEGEIIANNCSKIGINVILEEVKIAEENNLD